MTMEAQALISPLVTVEEVAHLVRLTPAAIRRMIRAREIPATRIGREYRIPRRVVENWLAPLNETNLKEAAFGLWKGKKHPPGEEWVREHREKDPRSLEEILAELESV